jgi:hypothetical protein
VRKNPWLQLQGRQHVCLSRIAQLEADVRPPKEEVRV